MSHSHAAPPAPTTEQLGYDIGLLLMRVVVGLTMAGHGTQKLFGWFNGPGLDATAQGFAAYGYEHEEPMALLAALTETVGGLGLALGLLTPLAAAGIIGVMINAIATRWADAFFLPTGIEFEVVLLAVAAGLALTGPGRLAVDHLLPVVRFHRLSYGVGAVVLGVVTGLVVVLAFR
ncbi:DoxX family protein [Streptomyces sp. LX-29]|uniref:DoxX family protein n=1 Tax=Streptomyces sp. LX-29 TaxID=2900152 RepID=UPI00240E0F37|nr:DoxX family protein [Streptomyces sp. LX-29]WFB08032.1 DoxX family protein [Streptomyces sp. LX-29]